MKALFIVHGFPPAQHSGVFRTQAFAKYLPTHGIQPIVVAASDGDRVLPYPSQEPSSHPAGTDPVFRTDWKLVTPMPDWPLTRRLLWRVPLLAHLAREAFHEEVVQRVLPLARHAIAEHRPEVIYASSPPEEALLIADSIRRETGLPLVCDLRDPWTYGFDKLYRHKLGFFMERNLERRVLGAASMVIANTPTAAALLTGEIGLPQDRVVVIPNGYDEDDFADPAPPGDLEPGCFTVVYSGILSSHRAADTGLRQAIKRAAGVNYHPVQSDRNTRSPVYVLQAARELLDDQPALRKVLRIWFVGSFSPDQEETIRSFPHPGCVLLKPPVSRREAVMLCRRAHLLLLLQIEMKLNGRDFCTAVPGKLFDYLRSGTRILAPMQHSDSQRIIEELGAGTVVPPRDTQAIKTALLDEIRQWQTGDRRRRELSKDLSIYDRRNLTARLAEVLTEAARTGH